MLEDELSSLQESLEGGGLLHLAKPKNLPGMVYTLDDFGIEYSIDDEISSESDSVKQLQYLSYSKMIPATRAN